jgi:hypothetical protein
MRGQGLCLNVIHHLGPDGATDVGFIYFDCTGEDRRDVTGESLPDGG